MGGGGGDSNSHHLSDFLCTSLCRITRIRLLENYYGHKTQQSKSHPQPVSVAPATHNLLPTQLMLHASINYMKSW